MELYQLRTFAVVAEEGRPAKGRQTHTHRDEPIRPEGDDRQREQDAEQKARAGDNE